MNGKTPALFRATSQVWEDLVADFLEIACLLEPDERLPLLQALRQANLNAERICAYPCFSIAGTFIIVLDGHSTEIRSEESRKCWLYDPASAQIRKAEI